MLKVGQAEVSAPADMLELIHELRVHQAELEIQNEELQRAQQEITALQKEYADLYEFAPCGYIVLSSRKMISRINLTAVRLLDAERVRLKQMPFSNLISNTSQDTYYLALQRTARTGDRTSVDVRLKTHGDSESWIRIDIQPDLDQTGSLVQWRLTLVDVTDRKQAERQLEDARHQADAASQAKSQFLANLSHEIRTPMSVITGVTEFLAMEDLSKEQRSQVEVLRQSGECLDVGFDDYLAKPIVMDELRRILSQYLEAAE